MVLLRLLLENAAESERRLGPNNVACLQDVSKCVGDPCPNGRMVETVARVKVEVWRCATDDVEPRVWLIVASERKE